MHLQRKFTLTHLVHSKPAKGTCSGRRLGPGRHFGWAPALVMVLGLAMHGKPGAEVRGGTLYTVCV